MDKNDPESLTALVELATEYWLPRCLHVVADLGVADALGNEARSAAELAAATGANADALERMLRLLASRGIFTHQDGRYSHNDLSRALRDDHPHSVRAYVRMVGLPIFWNSYGQMERVARDGKPAVNHIDPRGIFAYFKDHPEETAIFDAGMKAKAQGAIYPVLDAYDFSQFSTIADIGGGLGHLLRAILKSSPRLKGVLFDQPHVVERAEPAERLETLGGDFFQGPLPRCDAYVMMEVIHDWTDDQALQILQQIRKAAPPNAKLLIVETVLPIDGSFHFANQLDITMMVMTGGRERTPQQFERLLAEAGFQMLKVIPAKGPYSIVEAVTIH